MTTNQEREDILAMADDGDVTKLSDGRTIRLRIEPDDLDPFEEFDVYGKVELAGGPWNRDGMRKSRPDGFTGNAEKIWAVQNGECYWWEPPADGPRRGTPEFDKFRWFIRELLAFGCHGYILELLDGTDAYGRPIVRDTASLWGIEYGEDDAYRRTIIADLLEELGQ